MGIVNNLGAIEHFSFTLGEGWTINTELFIETFEHDVITNE